MLGRSRERKYRARTKAAIQNEEWADVAASVEQWKTVFPDAVEPYIFLAEACFKQSQLEACEEACHAGLALSPGSSPLLRYLARIERRRGDVNRAIEYFERALPEDKRPERTLELIQECRAEAESRKADESHKQLKKKDDLIQQYFSRLSDAESELFEAQAELENLKQSSHDVKKDLEDRLTQVSRRADDAEARYERAKEAHETFKREAELRAQNLQSMHDHELAAKQSALVELRKSFESKKAEWDETRTNLEAQLVSLEAALNEERNTVGALKTEVGDKVSRLEETRSTHREQLQAMEKSLNAEREAFASHRAEAEEKQRELIAAKQSEIKRIAESFAHERAAWDEERATRGEHLRSVEAELEQARQALEQFKMQADEDKRRLSEGHESEIRQLKEALEEERSNATEKFSALHDELKASHAQLEEARVQLARANATLEDRQKMIDRLRDEQRIQNENRQRVQEILERI